jgi:hypothetical protein
MRHTDLRNILKYGIYRELLSRGLLESFCIANNIKYEYKALNKKNYWTLEQCKTDALKYDSKNEWSKNSGSIYNTAYRKDWLEECCAHMQQPVKPKNYWTLELCKADALKYDSRSEWSKKSGGAYNSAHTKGWINVCCKHMKSKYKPYGYWTLEQCKADALKYNSKSEWTKNSKMAVNVTYKNGWVEECCAHMKKIVPKNYWTLELCKADALKYDSKSEWKIKSSSAYMNAYKKGWLKQCCEYYTSK